MRKPKIGDIVHYSYVIDSAPYAAIILKIENKDIFILKVFDRELEDGDDEVIRCSYSQMPKAYHWSWPEEAQEEKPKECEHNFDCLNLNNNKLHCGKCHVEKPVQTNKAEELIEKIWDCSHIEDAHELIEKYKGIK